MIRASFATNHLLAAAEQNTDRFVQVYTFKIDKNVPSLFAMLTTTQAPRLRGREINRTAIVTSPPPADSRNRPYRERVAPADELFTTAVTGNERPCQIPRSQRLRLRGGTAGRGNQKENSQIVPTTRKWKRAQSHACWLDSKAFIQ